MAKRRISEAEKLEGGENGEEAAAAKERRRNIYKPVSVALNCLLQTENDV